MGLTSTTPNGKPPGPCAPSADAENVYDHFGLSDRPKVLGDLSIDFSAGHIYLVRTTDTGGGTAAIQGWVDGVEYPAVTGQTLGWIDEPMIGARRGYSQTLNGLIAEVMVFDAALSPAELDSYGSALARTYGIDWTAIPEPASLAMLAVGGLAVAIRRRR